MTRRVKRVWNGLKRKGLGAIVVAFSGVNMTNTITALYVCQ